MPDRPIIPALEEVIAERRARPDDGRSYVASLMAGGTSRIGEKVLEEAAELIASAGETGPEGRAHVVHEAADLVFHALVLLGFRGVAWSEVEGELARRFGISGIEEKAARHGGRDA